MDIHGKTATEIAADIKSGAFGDLDQLITFARELRRKADDSRRDFILFLQAFEQSEVWKQLDAGTFEKFIDRNHICSSERYTHAVYTLKVIPAKTVDVVSFDAACEAAKIQEPARRTAALKKMVDWTHKNLRPPSPQKARELAEIRPITRRARCVSCGRLTAEIDRLKEDNKRLRALVKKLGGDPDLAAKAKRKSASNQSEATAE